MKKIKVTEKEFCDAVHSAIGDDIELVQLFNKLFKKNGGEQCQLKK